ncbi:hypothetical protein HK100_003603 [Physocladia obscura]|uniref:Uncharacterized protein n=1 Tax=Physocladia obscura TaxID=109957 RepID=A0AAD5STU6_9FUNG|nr:hypothetical protein HK100_003603 [Physocladia obscura]
MNNGCGKDLEHGERLCQEHKQQEAQYNAQEEHRMSSRRSQEKAKTLKLEWNYSFLPYATLLLHRQEQFKIFVIQRPIKTSGQFPESQTFLEILTQPIYKIIALDTACGTGKWHQPTVPVGNSRRGIDLSMVSFHVLETNMWYYASRRGGDINRFGVQWRMKQWLGGPGSWMNPAKMPSDQVVDELTFVNHLSLLCAKKTTLEYGPSCDTIRINSLLQLYNLPLVNFFNLGDGISYSRKQSPANRFIFGPPGIVGTPVADLSHLTYFHPTPPRFNSRMWDIDGQNPSVIQPRLKDVPQTLPPSDPSCDVQRTLNLYFTYRDAYHHV